MDARRSSRLATPSPPEPRPVEKGSSDKTTRRKDDESPAPRYRKRAAGPASSPFEPFAAGLRAGKESDSPRRKGPRYSQTPQVELPQEQLPRYPRRERKQPHTYAEEMEEIDERKEEEREYREEATCRRSDRQRRPPVRYEDELAALREREDAEKHRNPYGLHRSAPFHRARVDDRHTPQHTPRRRAADWSERSQSDSSDEERNEWAYFRRKPAHLIAEGSKKHTEVVQSVKIDESKDWKCIGGMKDHINQVKECVLFPLLYPELFEHLHVSAPRGVLLHGPPGTGKTLLVRCLAGACKQANLPVTLYLRKGADVLSKWVGEGERQLRLLFDEARAHAPAIIFFDEIDGLAPVRAAKNDQVHTSIVATLLAQMDGLEERGQVVVLGATNRPDAVDPALRRPGRFDRELRFSLPGAEERSQILQVHTASWPNPPSLDFCDQLGEEMVGCSGADIQAVTQEAALVSLRRTFPQIYREDAALAIDPTQVRITERDFHRALRDVRPRALRMDALSGRRELAPHWQRLFQRQLAALQETLRAPTRRTMLALADPTGEMASLLLPGALFRLQGTKVLPLDVASGLRDEVTLPQFAAKQVAEAVARAPSILYCPDAQRWEEAGEEALLGLAAALQQVPPDAPVMLLATEAPPVLGCATLELPPTEDQDVEGMWRVWLDRNFRQRFDDEWTLQASRCDLPKLPKRQARPPEPKAPVGVAIPDWSSMPQADLEHHQQEEEKHFRLFRSQVREILHALIRHPRFRIFTKSVDTKKFTDYLEYVKDPMSLEDMIKSNNEEEYEDVESVKADFVRIASNARKYSPGVLKIDSYATEFEDTALLKLECMDEELVKEWNNFRILRDARDKWEAQREKSKNAKAPARPRERAPRASGATGARGSSRLAGASVDDAPEGRADDLLPPAIAAKLTAAAKKLTAAVKPRKGGGLIPATLALAERIEQTTAETDPERVVRGKKLELFVYWLFQNKQEHLGLGAVSGDKCDCKRLEAAVDEFCANVLAA